MKKTSPRKIIIGADHAGFELKKRLIAYIKKELKTTDGTHIDVEDMGAYALVADDDYPAILTPLAMRVAMKPEHTVGIVLGGSGTGEAIVCNRFPGVRAAVYYGGGYMSDESVDGLAPGADKAGKSSLDIVRLAREHNDANVLSLGARFVTDDEACAAVRLFLETEFSGEERHARRIAQINEIE